MTFTMVAGFPHATSKLKPFIVFPFLWPEDATDNFTPVTDPALSEKEKHQHPIHIALKWQHCLNHNETLTLSKIAETQGISRARVTQTMSLLKLHPAIQERLKVLETHHEIRFFSERKLLGTAQSICHITTVPTLVPQRQLFTEVVLFNCVVCSLKRL